MFPSPLTGEGWGGGEKLAPKISICIIGDGNENNLYHSLSASGQMAGEVIVANGSSTATSPDSKTEGGFSYVLAPAQSDPADTITDMISKANGEWILILKAGETISAEDCRKISELCRTDKAQACRFILQIKIKYGELGRYEWIGNQGKNSRPQVIENGYIPFTGIRLFKKTAVKKVLSFDGGILNLEFNDNTSFINSFDISISEAENSINAHQVLGVNEKRQKDKQLFSQLVETFSEFPQNPELIGPGKIGYSLISEKDLPSLEAGLDMGFGRIEILKWAVHNLIKKGMYQKALNFADKILNSFSEFLEAFEIWHLKGIAFFHKLDFKSAEESMRKALELNASDMNTLSDLVRVYIVSGKLSEAKMLMENVISHYGLTPENEYIYKAILHNNNKQAKVSLLMLCRDEEEYIGMALESVRSIFDEIIAVDTGSTDKTIDILKDYDAKIISYNWDDDFAAARNYGLGHVSGDYVFCMDADEYIEDKDRLSFLVFKNLLPVKEKTGVVFNIHILNPDYDINAQGIPPVAIVKRTALFPNHPDIRFSGKVFENVDSSLQALNIPFVFAESISIRHHSRNSSFRAGRKITAIEKSAHDFSVEKLFEVIQFWLDVKNIKMAVKWFEYAISLTDGKRIYLNTICKLLDVFNDREFIRYLPEILNKLISVYGASYRISTACADYLYELKEYDEANKLLKRLSGINGYKFIDEPQLMDIQKNRLRFAMASLEQDDFETCNNMISLLAGDHNMADASRALAFYKAIRLKNLDEAILILDGWIKERNIPISGAINNFADFIRVISNFSEIVADYGHIEVSNILIRSADYFASTITRAV